MSTGSGSLAGLSALKLALMAQQARAEVGAITRAEPIAIIGMGCRFPGGANSPAQLWELLSNGVDAVGDIPAGRWDIAGFHADDASVPGRTSVTQGGFLDHVDQFDAGFFGIIRREAEKMDPQHRLFLETSIEALDHAGVPRERLAGSATGVFVASYYDDYAGMQFADRDRIDGRTLTGAMQSVLSNRLSWLLDLRGPSLTVDTACSSSLVAVHLACQSLRTGESSVALAGGVSLMLAPEVMITLDKMGFMSPTGRCRTLDAGADGFIRGEGCGVVVLKRLSDALGDGDRVWSVIRGTAVNQDGHSTVLAAPNGLAQRALVQQALADAQLAPGRVGYVEMHGTATPLGDPIEVEALAAAVGALRPDGSSCYLGSVKANLGHLEAAAGVAGLIKATLVLHHGEIPRQVHFTKLNPHISLDGTCLAVADRHRAWPAASLPRVAGVSGFGVGGTNAHALVEEAPVLPAEPAAEGGAIVLLPLSAQSEPALRALAAKWIPLLGATTAPLSSVCATAGSRRSHYDHRVAVTGRTASALVSQLEAFVQGDALSVRHGRRAAGDVARVGFVFSGQGPQWAGMGRELREREPRFRDAMEAVDERFRALSGWSLLEALAEPEATSRIMDTEVAQPAIFAVQVALAALWDSWGVRPHAVVGHSVGELAALHVAGVLSLEDAVRIVYHRGRIMQRATGQGGMAAVGLTAADAARLVEEIGTGISLAAVNGPRSTVLSGSTEALNRALALLSSRHVAHRALPVSYAFHSAQMGPLREELRAAIGPLTTHPERLEVYSTVTGGRVTRGDVDPAYVAGNIRDTVLFAPAVDALLERPIDALLELAPHPVLATSLSECLTARGLEVPVLASLKRGCDERETMLQACGGIYVVGGAPHWEAVMPLRDLPVELPSYPWQRERYWIPDFDRYGAGGSTTAKAQSPLLGMRRDGEADGTITFEAAWPVAELQWLADHRIAGRVVMPAAAMLEAMRLAVQAAHGGGRTTLSEFVVHEPLLLSERGDVRGQWCTVVRREAGETHVELRARDGAPVREPARGRTIASARAVVGGAAPAYLEDAPPRDGRDMEADSWYLGLAALGLSFGTNFRTIECLQRATDAAEGWLVRRAPAPGVSADGMHATVLDGMMQLCASAIMGTDDGEPGALWLPMGLDSYSVLCRVPDRVRAVVRVDRDAASGEVTAQARLLDASGTVLAVVTGARFAPADARALVRMAHAASEDELDADVYSLAWRRVAPPVAPGASAAAGRWIVLTNGGELGTAIVAALRSHGGECALWSPGSRTAAVTDGWTLAPSDTRALHTALSRAASAPGAALRGIVHAFSLDLPEAGAATDAADAADADWMVTGSALYTVQALGALALETPLWLVTRCAQDVDGGVSQAQPAGLWGLANVVALEYGGLPCRAVDLGPGSAADEALSLVRELLRANEPNSRVALRAGERLAPVLEPYHSARPTSTAIPRDARLEPPASGTLDDLHWVAATPGTPGPDEVRLRVQFAGVNFRDVLLSLGMYPGPDGVLGAECAGVVEAVGAEVHDLRVGDPVFGFAPGSLSTSVVVPAAFVAPVPDGLNAEQSAGQPVAFLTAMLGLYRIANLGAGSRVLVHAAAGGVGLAAVQLAQRRGAIVFATTGSTAKREYLRSIGVSHVYDSRTVAFADQILEATHGDGVHVVLNSLAGEFIAAGVTSLARNGVFLELGKRDRWSPARMSAARPDVRYRPYDLGVEALRDHALLRGMFHELRQWLADGSLRPLPVRSFAFGEAAEAFRFMAQARHIGKLVLRAPAVATGAPGSVVRNHRTYLVTGGTGALGLRTARWLAESGARSVVLTSRHAPGRDATAVIESIRALGAELHVRVADAADEAAMAALLQEIGRTMPPLRGVVHAAGIVDDGMLLDYTWDRWRAVLHGKARGARVLDRLTRRLPLDFFVLYSSAGLHLGPIGQGAYAAANAELDALASERRARGLPGLSVAWGQWPDSGMAAAMKSRGPDAWSTRGLGWIEPARAFAQLERLLRDGATCAVIVPVHWNTFVSQLPHGLDRDFFRAVAPTARASTTATGGDPNANAGVALVEQWRALPASERRHQLFAHVARCTRQVLSVGADFPIAPQVALRDVGLDSLMAVELRNVLTRSVGKALPATLLFDHPSLDALVAYLQKTLRLDLPQPANAGAEPPDANGAELENMSDEDAEATLLAELNEPIMKSRS